MARDDKQTVKQPAQARTPKVGQWVTLWFPEANGLRAFPAQIMARGRLYGFDVNVQKPGMLPRLMAGCPFSDAPKARCLTWDAPAVDEAFIPNAPEPASAPARELATATV